MLQAKLFALKQELEEAAIGQEGTLAALRQKHNNTMADLGEQIDSLNANKVKSEKDTAGMELDLRDARLDLEDAVLLQPAPARGRRRGPGGARSARPRPATGAPRAGSAPRPRRPRGRRARGARGPRRPRAPARRHTASPARRDPRSPGRPSLDRSGLRGRTAVRMRRQYPYIASWPLFAQPTRTLYVHA